MPILSFSSNDIDVITGKKRRTIRKLWKTPLKKGDRLYCYWNLVSKEKMKIFEAIVTDVEDIAFEEIIGNDEIAREEGFKDSNDMLREFKKMYGGRVDASDKFQVIYFEKLDIDYWKMIKSALFWTSLKFYSITCSPNSPVLTLTTPSNNGFISRASLTKS